MPETLPSAAGFWEYDWNVVALPAGQIVPILPGDSERWSLRIGLPFGPVAGTALYSPNPDLDTSIWKVVPATWDEWKWVEWGTLVQAPWFAFNAANSTIIVVSTKWRR